MADATDLKSGGENREGSSPSSPTREEFYYRCRESIWSSGDRFLAPIVKVYTIPFRILSKTKCGVWIEDYSGHRKFVLDGAKNSWARPTKEEAIRDFRARKRRQIKILKAKLQVAEAALKAEIE